MTHDITSLAQLLQLLQEAVAEANEIRDDADAYNALAAAVSGLGIDISIRITSGAQTLPVLGNAS